MFQGRNSLRKLHKQGLQSYKGCLCSPRNQRLMTSFTKPRNHFPWRYVLPAAVGVAASSFAFIATSQKSPLPYPGDYDLRDTKPLVVSYYTNEPHNLSEVTDIPGFMAAMWVSERLNEYSQTKDGFTVKDDLLFDISSRLALLRHGGVEGSRQGKTECLRKFAESESSRLKNSSFGREICDLSLMSEDAKTAWVADSIGYFIFSESMDEPPPLSKLEDWTGQSIDRGHFEESKFMTVLNDVERVIIIEMYKEARKAYQNAKAREEMEAMGLPVAFAQDMKLTDAMMDVYWRLSRDKVLKGVVHVDDIGH
ncbi:hypothetical protein Vi05172_g12492 [Venturia inaequalis]|nr:hypothetical protein Vi05172_g12492 [Venturia inaequalis]